MHSTIYKDTEVDLQFNVESEKVGRAREVYFPLVSVVQEKKESRVVYRFEHLKFMPPGGSIKSV